MAGVILDRLWLHDANDLSVYRRFFTTDRADSRTMQGDVRRYAGGRLRLIVRAGRQTQLQAKLRLVTDDDLAQLEEWQGSLLMLRDMRGRLVFGAYFALDVFDYEDRSGYDVAFAFREVTHSIEV